MVLFMGAKAVHANTTLGSLFHPQSVSPSPVAQGDKCPAERGGHVHRGKSPHDGEERGIIRLWCGVSGNCKGEQREVWVQPECGPGRG